MDLFPVDCTLSTTTGQSSNKRIISETHVIPTNIQRLLFPSLAASIGDTKLDAFYTIVSSVYLLEGYLEREEDNNYPFCEMVVQLWLSHIAFYWRCSCFSFTSDMLVDWSGFIVQEYQYLVQNISVAQMGMLEFKGLPAFLLDRLQWKENCSVLATCFVDWSETASLV